ncbi:MAG: divergent polysaccharide deacetylase family protein [Alphaproteobacteria bacterium]|nr:divergent polysaccharide deacetylase family protein [Alphaproteobacteria bacterium]
MARPPATPAGKSAAKTPPPEDEPDDVAPDTDDGDAAHSRGEAPEPATDGDNDPDFDFDDEPRLVQSGAGSSDDADDDVLPDDENPDEPSSENEPTNARSRWLSPVALAAYGIGLLLLAGIAVLQLTYQGENTGKKEPASAVVALALPPVVEAPPTASSSPTPVPPEPQRPGAGPRPPTPAAPAAGTAATRPQTSPSSRPEPRAPLPPAPDPTLLAKGNFGPVPVIAPDGRRPWQVYARPFPQESSRPRIAILLAGLGMSRAATTSAIQQLPSNISLSFTPYAPGLEQWIAAARAGGHEVFLELPMEPVDYPASDPGPHTLLTSLKPEENLTRLNFLLSRFSGYVGVTNFMGDKFTASAESLTPVLQDLRDRGLMILDARTSRGSVAAQLASDLDLPRAMNNRFLDQEASRVAIDARLLELERIAKQVGTAVGIGFPYPVTLERLAQWAPSLEAKGIDLAPISAIANRQSAQ